MFKKIPQDQVTRRTFQVNKTINLTQEDVTIFQVYNVSGSYDYDTDPKVGASGSFAGFSINGLYNSTKSRYYHPSASLFQTAGGFTKNQQYIFNAPATMSVLSFSQCIKGEGVLPGSFELVDSGSGLTIVDTEGSNQITNTNPEYLFNGWDSSTGIVTLADSASTELLIESIDAETGEAEVSFEGSQETPNPTLVSLNLETGVLAFSAPLEVLNQVDGASVSYGQLFQQSGDLVLDTGTNPDMLQNFDLSFKSTTTISELEVLVSVEPGEFTTSTNPSAVDYFNITTSSFEHTMTDERGNPYVETIKDFTPRKKSYIYSSYGNATGSFDDYDASSSLDPTGSYLTTYVSSIGLYNDNSELLAIAKVARPVKILPDYPINFLIKIDT